MIWRARFPATRGLAEALITQDFGDGLALVGGAVDDPDGPWVVDAYFTAPPARDVLDHLSGALAGATPTIERLADQDWITLSQVGLTPVSAGRFTVHTPDHGPAGPPGRFDLSIAASRAFGTGHHETTRGCLLALDMFHRGGRHFRRIADIGTGTGVLAFAAHRLWPHARIVASDIDGQAVATARGFARDNAIAIGRGPGAVTLVTAPATSHRLIQRCAPFDLVIANILAGPLIAMAPSLAAILRPGGVLILAGLLSDQIPDVVRAAHRAGLALVAVRHDGDWPTLRFRRRHGHRTRPGRSQRPATGDTGEW